MPCWSRFHASICQPSICTQLFLVPACRLTHRNTEQLISYVCQISKERTNCTSTSRPPIQHNVASHLQAAKNIHSSFSKIVIQDRHSYHRLAATVTQDGQSLTQPLQDWNGGSSLSCRQGHICLLRQKMLMMLSIWRLNVRLDMSMMLSTNGKLRYLLA